MRRFTSILARRALPGARRGGRSGANLSDRPIKVLGADSDEEG